MNKTELSVSSIITIAVVVGYLLIPTSTTRVVEYGCSVPMNGDGQCPGKIIRRSALRFIVNQKTGAVAWTVDRNEGDWGIAGGVFSKCDVVDSDNWQCSTDGLGETIGLHEGVYTRRSPGVGGYEIPGYTGLAYWRERVFALLGK